MCRCIDLFIDESDTSILYSIHMFDQYDRRCYFFFSTQTIVETSELFDQHLLFSNVIQHKNTVPAINEASHHMVVLSSNFSKQN